MADTKSTRLPRAATRGNPQDSGLTGQLPLPVGKPSRTQYLSPGERSTLEDYGWREGLPVPANAAEIITKARAEIAAENLAPPVPLDTKPIKAPPVVDLKSLPADHRARIQASLAEAVRQQEVDEAAARDEEAALRRGVNPKVLQAAQQLRGGSPLFKNDLRLPQSASPQEPEPPAPEEDVAESTPGSDLFSGPRLCPHCGFDQSREDIPEPSYIEKQAFLQSMLAPKPYLQRVGLMADQLLVTFRTLTTNEVRAVYKQVEAEEAKQPFPSALEKWERLNRYRMYLQIVDLEGAQLTELPDGLSQGTNPLAKSWWNGPDEPQAIPDLLPQIEEHLLKEVLVTEHLQRVVSTAAARFNRLVVKLEAMVDCEDFWQPTEAQS